MIEVAGATDRGVSKPLNEDRIVVQDAVVCGGSLHVQRQAPLCLAVFDGVSTGGHGSEAVGLASATLSESLSGAGAVSTPSELSDLFGGINEDLRAYAQKRLSGAQAATTVGGLFFGKAGELSAFFAGDSRVYRLRAGAIEQLSHDHTIIQRLKDENATELLAGMAQVGAHSVTRALGRSDDNPVEMVTGLGPVRMGDVYLICSDGVTDGLSDEVLAEVMGNEDLPLDDRARDLVARAKAEGGSNDNVTALLAHVFDDGLTGDATGYLEAVELDEQVDTEDPADTDKPNDVEEPVDSKEESPQEESEEPKDIEQQPANVDDPDKTGVIDYDALDRAQAAAESHEDMAAFEAWVSGDEVKPVDDDEADGEERETTR